MKKALFVGLLLASMLPGVAAAHATPLSSSPVSSSRVETMPAEISIRFSERLDEGASTIIVKGPDGSTVSEGKARVDDSDPRLLSVPLRGGGEGAYIVTWSVVSSDDGHFTRGSYPFVVGSAALPEMRAGDFEVVQIATTPEAVAMTAELFGNGLVWAGILIFAFAVRPLLRNGAYAALKNDLKRGYGWILISGFALALCGAAAQILLKAQDLARIQEIALLEALQVYAGATAGGATVARMLAVVFAAIVYAAMRRVIFASARFTVGEGLILLGMSVFAYYRAVVSHATANPFFPELSVAVNFVHLIEKDFWAGAAVVLALLVVLRRFQAVLEPLMHRIFVMLSVNLALVAVTASYIVWLHLKAFENLFSTQWGVVFMQLLIAAVALVAVRSYHILARLWSPRIFSRVLPLTLGAEAALAVSVVFYSSVVIITSPPLPSAIGPVFMASDQGVRIELRASAIEEGVALLSISGGNPTEPAVTVGGRSTGVISVAPEEKFDGEYRFPLSLIDAGEERTVSVRVPQEDAYDAIAEFTVLPDAFDANVESSSRHVDAFTLTMLGIGALALLYALLMYRLTRRLAPLRPLDRFAFPGAFAGAGFTVAALLITGGTSAYGSSPFANPFKARCEADGNMWHLMLPMRAGVPLSETPREGCMWGMGNYQYMFADEREYRHYSSLPETSVELDFGSDALMAGVPQDFTIAIRYDDGAPAELFVDMEKLIHTVIVSKDQTVFAHIHPDDARALSPEEIENSTFELSYTFPKAGEYLLSVDYASGVELRSAQFPITVAGGPAQGDTVFYESVQQVGPYTVSLDTSPLRAGEVSTLYYDIRKDGAAAELRPYLSAAMHIAVVKNDFNAFAHTHGEVHPPGATPPPPIVRDGKIVHSMTAMYTPSRFSTPVDAHVIFPEPGVYTVWGQFMSGDEVIEVPFTLRVE